MNPAPPDASDAYEVRGLDRAPIARILVAAAGQVMSRGTGTLIAPRLVLSALHVVANRRPDPPEPYPGEITLEFPGFTTTGTLVPRAFDRTADWVLIECAEAPPMAPMSLASLHENKREWESFGFPDANARDGLLLSGTVMMCDGTLEGMRAHQLYCVQAAAGSGGRVKGMSGAPVVIAGRLVGVMRFALMEQDRTEMGTLYACPVSAVGERWPTLDVPPLPKLPRKSLTQQILAANALHAGWELAAIAGSLLVAAATVFALSQMHVGTARVEGTVYTEDVQFRLPRAAPMLLGVDGGLLKVAAVDAAGLVSTSVPTPDGSRASLAMQTAHLEPAPGNDSTNQLALDLSPPLAAGARVWLHLAEPRTRYRLRIDSAQNPLHAAFFGTVQVGQSAANLKPYRTATGDSLLLVPRDGKTIVAEMSLRGGAEVLLALDTPLPVTQLGFYASETSASGPVRVPTTARGELKIDGPGNAASVPVKLRDSLSFGANAMTIKGMRFPADANGVIEITFFGTVTALRVGSDGVVTNLMPTWLDRIRRQFAVEAAAVGAALVAFLAFLIMRWRRKPE